ncbi:MAG: sigma-70 family RNA polymerase sigma factor [Sedimentisphaerales bacterium]|nr:sigma-70 family RNA polymerase sigma factor [Sedimentisphaerales bacterium]
MNEHGGRVLRTAMRVLRDASLAHDVHQEVFLAIWRRWHKYDGQVNWTAYLYRATVRKALDLARRRARHGMPVGTVETQDSASLHAVTTNGPDGALAADELEQRLASVLARLPRREADAFILSRLERLETAEIAGIMGCAESTVRVHLHRAVAKLACQLREYLDQ